MGSQSQPFFHVVVQPAPPTAENLLQWLEIRVCSPHGLQVLNGKGHECVVTERRGVLHPPIC
jgi:hypothetical protein